MTAAGYTDWSRAGLVFVRNRSHLLSFVVFFQIAVEIVKKGSVFGTAVSKCVAVARSLATASRGACAGVCLLTAMHRASQWLLLG